MSGSESRKKLCSSFISDNIYSDVVLHLSAGFHVYGEDKNKTYFLKLKNNLYGIRQASVNWFDMLKTRFEDEC